MLSVTDILKILDQVPLWKTLKALPKRIEELEARVAQLEAERLAPPKVPGEPCPACGERALRRTSSTPLPGRVGANGARNEVWTCEACGKTDERTKIPSV